MSSFIFDGFSSPNYTQVPDEFFDYLAPRLSEPELRVLLYVFRRTFGFKKSADDISIKQLVDGIQTRDGRVLDEGTGLSKPSVIKGVRGLEEKGIIVAVRHESRERGFETTSYQLRFKTGQAPLSTSFTSPPSKRALPGASQPDLPALVNGVNPQETVLQETAQQQTALPSKYSKASTNSMVAQEGKREEKRSVENTKPVALGDLLAQHQTAQNAPKRTLRSTAAHQSTSADSERAGGVLAPLPTAATNAATVSQQSIPTPQLDAAIEEASRRLGDWYHRKSNTTQARNLLRDSGLAEPQLAQLCYEELANVADRDRSRIMPQVQNPMGYFFECLRQRLADLEARQVTDTTAREPTDGGEEPWAPLSAEVDAAALWETVLGKLEQQVTRPIFETFLRGTAGTRRADGALLVATATPFAQEGLATKLRPLVLQTVRAIAGAAIAVDFLTSENAPGP